MADRSEKRYSAPALEKGLDILEFLAEQSAPCSKAEIGDALQRTPSEIYRMLCVLEQRGYVLKQTGTTAYSLTLKLFELGHLQSTVSTLRKAIRLPMEQLADSIGQACHFSIQSGSDLLVMMERMPTRRICLAVGEGTVLPMTQAASGSVILSALSDQEVERLLTQDAHFQQLSLTKQKKYTQHIATVRAQGYEKAHSQITKGVIDIALPIGIAGTDIFGALAVSFLESALDAPNIKKHLKTMQHCSQSIHSNLGI